MARMKSDFLQSASELNENQAEYNILTELYSACLDKIFLFRICELRSIQKYYDDAIKYINTNYNSYNLKLFTLKESGEMDVEQIKSKSGSSFSDDELINWALELSQSGERILLRTNDVFVLVQNGRFDDKFGNTFSDKRKMLEAEQEKRNIDQLEWAFEEFHVERKFRGCEYIVSGKVRDDISEQELRNSLMEFLRKKTKLFIVPELCTSKTEDEESVDIGVIDSDKRVAIIEVKYFVKQGMFQSDKKSAYSESRFRDGYKQLDKYCIHLNQDNYDLHSAFLYMFYAHSKTKEEIMADAGSYLEKFMKNTEETCSDKFRNHYKATICDNMLDVK